MDGKQGNKQEQNPPGEGRPIQSYEDEHDTTNSSGGMRRMLQQQEGGQEEMPSNQRNLSLRSSSSNLLLDDILLDDADQQQQQDALGERGVVVEERCRHKQKNKKYNKIVEEESFENETRKSQGTISSCLSDENPGDRTAETEQQQEETSSDKTEEQNTESASKKDTKAKVRNLARNRRRKAKEWNEMKQEEIARLTKLNVQLKEKNQALINELIMLGVDTNTIQLFLNCLHITNQEVATAVPSPKYKFSL
ncbi:predicted protein [Chaetoceros tenuissimus]|uniref:BZIP domain-containing protein n=1 Tax=Chaetoceros tenuissimus TaxID=426638 RepID=A0AAD3HA86_9STRA|nr:predicted protein [Chaetoceros tenuissimus]